MAEAAGTDRELAKSVLFLKEENKLIRSRIKGEVHSKDRSHMVWEQ